MPQTTSLDVKTILHTVSDLAAAKPVYTALLGIEPQTDESYYVGYELGHIHVGLLPAGDEGVSQPIAYWEVPDIEAKIAELTSAGATVREPASAVGGGRQVATVTDADGNVIGILQDQ